MIKLGKESETVEFKKSTSELNEAIISIVSMLNKTGKGTVYFGVKNNGEAIGQEIGESTLRDISRKISEDISPAIYPSIRELDNSPGIIIVEFSGSDRPYSAKGKFYIRLHDEDKQMSINELLKEINYKDISNSSWERLRSNCAIKDVDEQLLKEYINKANKTGRIKEKYTNAQEVLSKLGLLNGNYLNNAGNVLFSKKKPLTLKLAVFASDEKLTFIDINRCSGNIFELIDKGQTYISEHLNYSATIKDKKRIEEAEIPLEAIREAVVNSFCHSSFNLSINNEIYLTPTRVSIFNPGQFPNNYTPNDFAYNGVSSVLRNPLIAEILYYSNDVESWATGFRRIFDTCEKHNVLTTYTNNDQGFTFTFYRKNKAMSNEETILNAIKNNPHIKTKEIAVLIDKTDRTARRMINKLIQEGKIRKEGTQKETTWIINK